MMGGMRINGGDVKALACQSGFGLGFGAVGFGLVGLVEMSDWVAFVACIVVCLAGVCVGVVVADRRGWL